MECSLWSLRAKRADYANANQAARILGSEMVRQPGREQNPLRRDGHYE